ncbi:hypothetical protein OCGS_0877 [Oceaniovalibus guishaninsula JLT2003]|uniref:Endonuclease/exonuclease/phosphatase domain-containing protein n=1 Tax=Oceaniovalibus guishaninsula JLT2003 TaxID=1231392 RepID=K2HFD9_9RHOB|nr:endonuclease/exonuclease/phosphatase family protein [Oceaniovalibus guishaninsula]EKE45182.1 hypothetical protein OCGS_0877 [Oceaniovalibus guishaninsula JLT2003]
MTRPRPRAVFWAGIAAILTLLLAGFGGRLHPAGDSLAVARIWLVVAGLIWIGAFVLRHAVRLRAALSLGAVLLAIAATTSAGWLQVAGRAVGPTVYQKNMSFRLRDTTALANDILALRPDIVTLQEIDDDNASLRQQISAALPSWHRCVSDTVGGEAIATHWPVLDRACGPGAAALRVQSPAGPLWIVSVHLHWPWPARQARQVADLLPWLETLDRPVIVAGDFNMVPWSWAVRSIARATGTARAGAPLHTFRVRSVAPVAIDNILLPGGTGRAATRPPLGSDHWGLVVTATEE